nr:hypothetical protein [Tanacetum cinerariifolium]
MQKNLALIAKYFKKIYKPTNNNLRTSSNLRNKNVDMTPRYKNDNHFGQVKDSAYHKEKMLLCKQAELGVPLQVEQYDWLSDTNEEVDEQELEAHYSYMAKIYEDDIHNDQNDVESDDERVALANLIANLKLDVDENKKIQKQLKKANTTLAQELKECKAILAETSKSLGESISVRDSYLVSLQTKQTEFEKFKAFNDQIVDNAWIKHSKDQFRALTAQDMEILIQTRLMPLATKTQNDSFRLVHELKQEMHADLKYFESLKKEINELEFEKAEFSDMYDVILKQYVSKDVMCSYLRSLSDLDALDELQCLYLHKVKECDCLAQKLSNQTESVSKEVHNELLKRFAKVEKHSISLEIALQKRKEQKPQSYFKMLYEKTSKTWKWWIEQQSPSGYKWVPKTKKQWVPKAKMQWVPKAKNDHVQKRIVQLILFIVDSGCAKHMTGNLKLLCNFVKKFLGVNHNTNVSRPHHRSNQFKDKVLTNNSQVKIVQLILFIVDSGYTNHMTDNLNLLCNFVEKFLGTVHFGNNQFVPILGYGDLVQGNVMINRGNDLLTGNCGSDLYTISLQESTSSTPLCVMANASPTQALLWHRRLSYLNFDYINLLSKKDMVIGLPKLKYIKDQLCSSFELSKAKRSSFKLKAVPSSKGRLNLLHIDLCGPMRVVSINGKKYIMVIVDDYSRYTWTMFLRSKDETPEVLKEFLTMIQRNLQARVITSKGYRVYNKRTRMIVESIHIRFDEVKEVSKTSVANDTSGLVSQ